MLTRRVFLTSLLAAIGVFPKNSLANMSKCGMFGCFDTDFDGFGYRYFYESYLAASAKVKASYMANGIAVPSKYQDLFQSEFSYSPTTIKASRYNSRRSYQMFNIDGMFGGIIPFRGIASIPNNPRGVCVVIHGMATTPERCFDYVNSDYMSAISHRLSESGYAVWCPFIPQGGNFPSMFVPYELQKLNGVSQHLLLCSIAAAQEKIFSKIASTTTSKYSVYGVSLGGLLGLHTALLDENVNTLIVSGYLRNDAPNPNIVNALLDRSTYPEYSNPAFSNYVLPNLAMHIRKLPILFEVGITDPSCTVVGGRDFVFKKFNEKLDSELVIHEGGHEVDGAKAIQWLSSINPPSEKIIN